MSNLTNGLRILSVAAVLLAGSCASDPGEGGLSPDGAVNHPIVVEPTNNSLKLSFSAPHAGLMPDDAAQLQAFVSNYLNNGTGAISISAPSGPDSQATIAYFGERLAAMGVARSRILVGTHDVSDTDTRVEIAYIGFGAHTAPCGDWSANLAETEANRTSPNFGCAVQQNIAAMVADPRDLISSRPQTGADEARRAAVFGHYEKGEPTGQTKSKDQSGVVSDIAQ